MFKSTIKSCFKSVFNPHDHFLIFIDFIGVTLVKKIMQVSGAQFYNTSCVHCIMCSPPQVRSLSALSPTASSTSPSNHRTMARVHEFFLSLVCSIPLSHHSVPQPVTPTAVSMLSICESVSFVSSVCSLDPTYEWNRRVLVFLWLANFTE